MSASAATPAYTPVPVGPSAICELDVDSESCAFIDNGGTEQTFTVPPGVTSIQVTAEGAAGQAGSAGLGENPVCMHGTSPGGAGGLGAVVSGSLPVTPGQKLYVEVGTVGGGGAGGDGYLAFPTFCDDYTPVSALSFTGGAGGSGGGESDVRTCSQSNPQCPGLGTSSDPRLIVAAGGGGGGGGGAAQQNLGTSGLAGSNGGASSNPNGGPPGVNSDGQGGTGEDISSNGIYGVGGGGGGGDGYRGGAGGFYGNGFQLGGYSGGGGSNLVPSGGSAGTTTDPAGVQISFTLSRSTTAALDVHPSTSVVYGQPMGLTALVASIDGRIPTGSVDFFAGAKLLAANVPLDPTTGQATTTLNDLDVGTYNLHVLYTGSDAFDPSDSAPPYNPETVSQASQTITFPPIGDKAMGTSQFDPGATASSGLPVTYSTGTSTACDVISNQVRIDAVGTCTVTASQAGNINYSAASPVVRTFTVNPGIPTSLTITPAISTIVAGTSQAYMVTGYDAYNDKINLAGLPLQIAPTNGGSANGASCTASTCTAIASGTYTVFAIIEAGVPDPPTALATLTVTPAAAASIAATSGSGQAATVNTAFTAPLVATVTDTYGNPIPDTPVTFTVNPPTTATPGRASFSGGVTAVTVNTGADGTATSPALSAGSTAGPLLITANTSGLPSTSAATFTETALSRTSAHADLALTLSAPTHVTPGSSEQVTATVTNAGPDIATHVLTAVLLPNGWNVGSTGGGTAVRRLVLFGAGSIAAHGTLTYTITLTAPLKTAAGLIAGTALSDVPDPKYSNNLAAALTSS